MNLPGVEGTDPSIRVETTPEDPDCPACGRQGILSAAVPHTIADARGQRITGTAVAVLCETCDIDDPDAGPLIAYFAVHGSISAETFHQGSTLVSLWLATARAKTFSQDVPGG